MRRVSTLSIIAIGVLALVGALARAATLPGDPVEGQQLANDICTECHDVERDSYDFIEGGAPAFQAVADDPAVTELSLRVFFRTPHETMPNVMLSDSETDNLISYILSLKQP